jgi:ribonuclease BN (tRNA processing enzyme)
MGLALTVLGGSPAWPNPRQAASGYLVEGEGLSLLLDCGWGVSPELRATDATPLTDVVISHFHPDHWFDLVPLHYAYRYGDWRGRPRPRLHLPPGGRRSLDVCSSAWGGSVESFDLAFDVSEYDPEVELRIHDGTTLRFAPSLHYTPSFSVDVRAADGARIAYSGDTAPTERLIRFAEEAPLFVCEASLLEASGDSDERGHMDALEAGEAAAKARVGRLLLTHVPVENGRERVVERARSRYSGPIDVAVPGLRLEVTTTA